MHPSQPPHFESLSQVTHGQMFHRDDTSGLRIVWVASGGSREVEVGQQHKRWLILRTGKTCGEVYAMSMTEGNVYTYENDLLLNTHCGMGGNVPWAVILCSMGQPGEPGGSDFATALRNLE